MTYKIIEVAGEPRKLALKRGLLMVAQKDKTIGEVDLDSILSLLVSSRGATISTNLSCELAERKIPVIYCDKKLAPVAITLPTIQHFDQTRRFFAQAQLPNKTKQKLWSCLVANKISNQAKHIERVTGTINARLLRLSKEVEIGDTKNVEAQAARIYWKLLFGQQFKRDRAETTINSLLNYGYTIIRSAMARAVISSGLHPTFSLHHKSKVNAFGLVDDLVEPYRILTDQIVYKLVRAGLIKLNVNTKESLAAVINSAHIGEKNNQNIFLHMQQNCNCLVRILNNEQAKFLSPNLFTKAQICKMTERC